MKLTSKKLISILLCAILGLSSVSAAGAFAAETSDFVSAEATGYAAANGEDPSEPDAEATEPITTEPITTEPAPTEPVSTQPTTNPVPAVGNVKNVVKTSFETNLITLTWDKVSGASGYYVYICNKDKSGTFTKVAEVKTNTVTVKNLEHTTQYWFKVSAFVTKNGQNYEGKQTQKKTATQPGKLTGLGKVRSSDVIEFNWTRNAKATGYRIYRTSAESNNKSVLYKTVKGNSNTSFTDKSVKAGRIYTYTVKAYRDLYDTTYNSPSGSIKFMCGLCAPNYTIESRLNRVNLSWNKNKYATGYDIYYSTSSDNSKFTKLAYTTKNFFNTVRLTNNKTYYFRVYPVYKSGSTTVTGTGHKKSITVTNKAFGKAPGNTYVEVSIKQQHMWLYKNGKLIVETDVVTGNADGAHNTPRGYHTIYQRARNTTLVGPGYASFVNYWMAFSGGCGIHDASWRSSYGGNIYQGNGSHGCINTPYSKVKKIYENTGYGTPVIVY